MAKRPSSVAVTGPSWASHAASDPPPGFQYSGFTTVP